MSSSGRRTGSRRGPRRRRGFQPALLLLAMGVTACVVAWGYLVYAAIDFGATAREGDPAAWWFLAVASVGAVACLFAGLMLILRMLRRLGITSGAAPRQVEPSPPDEVPRPVGGRRAAR